MRKLRETQTLLWRLITAPEGMSVASRASSDRGQGVLGGIATVVCGDDRLGAADRLDVYAKMYFARLLDALIEDFPAVHAVVGHQQFHGLAREYLEAHPSESPSIRALGRRLSGFLEGHPLSRGRAWLSDLASFEWALLEAFDAPDAAPVSADRLRGLAPREWPAARFRITPSLRIVEARAPVQEAWTAASAGREVPTIAEQPTALRVWREGFRVFHRAVDRAEVAALRALERGERFSEACEAAAAVVGERAAAASVAAALGRWVDDAMIVGVDTAPED